MKKIDLLNMAAFHWKSDVTALQCSYGHSLFFILFSSKFHMHKMEGAALTSDHSIQVFKPQLMERIKRICKEIFFPALRGDQ